MKTLALILITSLYQIGNSLTQDTLPPFGYHTKGSSRLVDIINGPAPNTVPGNGGSSGDGFIVDLVEYNGVLALQIWGKPNIGHSVQQDIDSVNYLVEYSDATDLILYAPHPPKDQLVNWYDVWVGPDPEYKRGYYEAIEDNISLPGNNIRWFWGGDYVYELWSTGQYTLDELYRDNLHASLDILRPLLNEQLSLVYGRYTGDYDLDAYVDGDDLGILLSHWNNPYTGLDLGVLLSNWNPDTQSVKYVVPEPPGWILIFSLILGLLLVREYFKNQIG